MILNPLNTTVGLVLSLVAAAGYAFITTNTAPQLEPQTVELNMEHKMDFETTSVLTWKDVMSLAKNGNKKPDRRVERSEAEWQKVLTEEQYYVMRKKGTERPFSSEMCSRFEPGIYACAGCGTPLFDSATKYQSGTGWPSFTLPMKDNVVSYIMDNTFGMTRVETICSTCDSHLGHVFPDGPEPSGLRFCINASSLKKVQSGS